ncbi:MAG: hypothetical protein QME12_06280 [Nanoarchaeota archaeon]|nr:hypothetical protein [Nanoarchaeota archaeon]
MGRIPGEPKEFSRGFFCRKCGHRIYTQSSGPMTRPKCGSPMAQSF